MNIQTGLCCN